MEIPAADPATSARFYAEVFGWEAREVEGGETPYFDLRSDGGPDRPGPTAGVTTPDILGGGGPLPVIHVEGRLEPVLERVVAAGGTVDLTPTPVPGHGTFARFRDPEGHRLGLWAAAAG